MDKLNDTQIQVQSKTGVHMNIQAKMSEQGADKAGETFANKVGDGIKGLLWLLGVAAVLAVIGHWW